MQNGEIPAPPFAVDGSVGRQRISLTWLREWCLYSGGTPSAPTASRGAAGADSLRSPEPTQVPQSTLPSGDDYIEYLRPKSAAGDKPPSWLRILSKRITEGDDFWS